MQLRAIIATRVRLNTAKRLSLNLNATRPVPCYPAPLAWLTR